ncbi:LANO_0F09714g1_1 [Lachancea nothofagi CBS 11611]|uniref:LANO_0F09714g1_1 n=1 Tax=Lachancea nothofagi CBS 11611 TaxID=1266666 RepID=A0A1G4KA34_9SACH|nr:LANO_0F09714g1_1 [Lachancea nothofagi CBS 11611]
MPEFCNVIGPISRYILFFPAIVLLANIIINAVIFWKDSLWGLTRVVTGVPLLNKIYFVRLLFRRSSISIGCIKFSLRRGFVIEVNDLYVRLDADRPSNLPQTKSEANPRMIINRHLSTILRHIWPIKLVLKNVKLQLSGPGSIISCENMELDICFSSEGSEPILNVTAAMIKDRNGRFILRMLQYNLYLSLERDKSKEMDHWCLRYHSHILILRGLRILGSCEQSQHESQQAKTPQATFPETSIADNSSLRFFMNTLRGLDIRLEDVSVVVRDPFSVNFSGVFMSLKTIDALHHGMLDSLPSDVSCPLIHEMALTVNSAVGLLNNQEVLRVPTLTLTSVSNLGSLLFVPKISNLTLGCTMAIVDPAVTITQFQLKELWILYTSSIFHSSESSTHDWRLIFEEAKSKSFIIKLIMSNASFTLKSSQSKHFVFRLNNLHAFAQHQPESKKDGVSKSVDIAGLKQTQNPLDNFLKIDKFSLRYFRFHEATSSKLFDVPIVIFSKWEFFSKNISSEKKDLTSTLRDLKLSLENIEVIEGASHLLDNWRSWLTPRASKLTSKPKFSLDYSLKLRLKNTTATVIVAHHLPRYLDAFGNTSTNLTEYARGVSVCLTEAFFDVYPGEYKLHVINGSISRVMEDSTQTLSYQEFALIEDFKLENSYAGYQCRTSAVKINFGVSTIWLYFFLKDIFKQFFQSNSAYVSSSSPVRHVKKSRLIESVGIEIVSTLIEVELPQSAKLLFTLQGTVFKGGSLILIVEKISVLTPSVYQSDDVLVTVLILNKLVTDLGSFSSDAASKIDADSLWLKFEYHLRLYKILDNICTMIKCFKRVGASFQDLSHFKATKLFAESPKAVSAIDFKTNTLSLNVEEDPFEQELGLIFKVGVSEQQERIEKLRLLEEELKSHFPYYNSAPTSPNNFNPKVMRLFEHFSTSWINRMRKARFAFFKNPLRTVRSEDIGSSSLRILEGLDSTVLKVEMETVTLKLRRPSFALQKCSDFLYKYGKKLPRDTTFTTLLPLGIRLEGGRCEFSLRDYPLPILYFPSLKISGDLVFAERMAHSFSKRYVYVPFVPGAEDEIHVSEDSIYGSKIIRTMNPLKTYMNLKCEIDSNIPTTITWGKSLQPGYQSVMIWFDYLTKPPLDPSEKLGFWDKIRLLIHGQLVFEWLGNSEIHLNLKGSHDPYLITDRGAGLSFCWRGNARLSIHESTDPTDFLKITSGQFLLGIRDFTQPKRLEKILMNLSGHVTWTMGISFESGNLKDPGVEKRSNAFKSHYEVNLWNPLFIDGDAGHDSYKGFRSDFIHLFFCVETDEKHESSNKVYLAPHSMTHFFKWWNLFSTYTSGPIRQGPLFPNLVQNPRKFSKALFTIKYKLQLSPLVISHTYRHADSQLASRKDEEMAFTSLKGTFKSLKLDLHQKRIKMTHADKKLQVSRTVWKLKMNAGEIDCVEADLRLIYTLLKSQSDRKVPPQKSQCMDDSGFKDVPQKNGNKFCSDWFDMEDYHDVNQALYKDAKPLAFEDSPFLYSPRISYLRKLSEGVPLDYPFGLERDHACSLGRNDPMVTQEALAKKRAEELEIQLDLIGKLITNLNSETNEGTDAKFRGQQLDALNRRLHDFRHRLHIIHKVLEDLMLSKLPSRSLISDDVESNFSNESANQAEAESQELMERLHTITTFRSMRKATSAFVKSSFDNRFIVHNILLKINNKTRDLMLDYAFNVLSRKKSSFYQTYKAVALLDELLKNKLWGLPSARAVDGDFFSSEDSLSNEELMEQFDSIIRQVMADGLKAFDTYQIKLVSPQIQITSKEVPLQCILITARDIETSIIDINQVPESTNQSIPLDVNSLVESRFCTRLNEAHFFIFDKQEVSSEDGLGFQLYGYGADENSKYWPPWLPMEMCYNCESLKDSVFLTRNDMIFYFIQPNSLYFQDKVKNIGRSETKVRIGFPRLTLASTSDQYSSIYAIAVELLHFASSFDKKADKLSKVMLAEEVRNNLDKLDVSIIINLQNSIKNLHRTRAYLRVNDPTCYDKVAQKIAAELDAAVLELNLLMTAVKKNHDKLKLSNGKDGTQDRVCWQIGADEVTWKLLDDQGENFVLFELGSTCYMRSQALDGTNNNKLVITSLECINLQESAVYKKLLSPYNAIVDVTKPLIQILWTIGPSIGGISDLVELVVLLEPFRFKMDHLTSDILLKYLFPARTNEAPVGISPRIAENGSFSTESRENSVVLNLSWRLKGPLPMSSSASLRNQSRNSQSAPTATFSRSTGRDMNEMVNRSSRYFNVGSVIIRKVMISISYKGSRSLITNVDGLTVKVPTLHYSNKLWSRDEFIATLKKDIIKIVLQHTGNIIGNKFTIHKKESEHKNSENYTTVSSLASGSPQSARFPPHEAGNTPRPSSLGFTSRQSSRISQDMQPNDEDVTGFYPTTH